MRNRESGFTLIELIYVTGMIGALSFLGINTFSAFKADAAYGVVADAMRNGRMAFEIGIIADTAPGSVALTTQTSAGSLSDGDANTLLTGFRVPANSSFQVSYDAGCSTAFCTSANIVVKHCLGDRYQTWTRFGDGSDVLVQDVAGDGCS